MGRYDFDKIIDRRGTGALKLEVLKERYGDADLLPLWVADMDFETPQFITDALRKRLEHSLFGYTVEPADYWTTVAQWIENHHDWQVKPEWMTYIPGIVKGIGMAINVFVKKDEKVIIQPPVYHPFRITPQDNEREVVFNPLTENEDGTYSMDFDNLKTVCDEKCRLLILSNPHNPAGIVWDRETLKRLADFCHQRNILVLSDEIHCDMALWDNKHIPFASVSKEAAECSITFGAPSKTFNIAGRIPPRGRMAKRDAPIHRKKHRLGHRLLRKAHPLHQTPAPASLLPRMARLPRPAPKPPGTGRPLREESPPGT